ncbi:MAG: type II toxin-antitoxin system PemK/MazF family toxin [Nanoarchaeota archaeon]|nr:type II toxin-antitoxin system PemK/MazF family toxin [Nanoarchaeota archaeon]
MMRPGIMLNSGDVILAKIQFSDTFEIKERPALVLFEEHGNVVVAGITSNRNMEGIPLLKKDGALRDSVIKLNYIFTISNKMISKFLFHLSQEKKRKVFDGFKIRLNNLLK